MTDKTRLWDRLSPQAKGALVGQWRRFADALTVAQSLGDSRDLVTAYRDAYQRETLAKTRSSYLFALDSLWFRLAWDDKSLPKSARLPEGGDLDGLLWEQHPGNLLDEIEEASK